MQKLCAHVKDVHNFDANIEKYTFPNKAEYEEWRKCVERKGCFQFVNPGSSSHGEGGIYLFCHCSGCYRPRGSNLQAPKVSFKKSSVGIFVPTVMNKTTIQEELNLSEESFSDQINGCNNRGCTTSSRSW
uniref:Uncharacterized protein n=1 Tax=Romanomermis culicivorax TaxID=13658 RepID=A0A915IK33_ROMCU